MQQKGRFTMMAAALVLCGMGTAYAMIPGVLGPDFQFTAKTGHISTPEGGSLLIWGYANGDGPAQYSGPTMIVNEGDIVTVELTNALDRPTSIVFPGQGDVVAELVSGGMDTGPLTVEANPGATVRYTWEATHPGTYHYHSGTQPDLQIEMGLVGAIIVRPEGFDPVTDKRAYGHPDSAYDEEFLFLLTEMDPIIHFLVELGYADQVDTSSFFPVYWFINGRCAPDTMFPAGVDWLPNQPYNCMPMIQPGERMLMRIIGGGRDAHPFHHHGNHARLIAEDGRLLSSTVGTGADLAQDLFTQPTVPGKTRDAIFTWTGEKLGWDIYGHQQDIDNPPTGDFPGPGDVDHDQDGDFDSVPLELDEYEPDHGKPFPVQLPDNLDLAFGGMWSGSPFLGAMGALPPGEGGMNPWAGFTYMWHSHTEKEMVNNDVFPGGMMTMLIVVPPRGDMDMAIPLEPGQNPINTER